MTTDRRRFYSDLLERVLWTAVQAFLGVLVADGLGAGVEDDTTGLKVAAIAAAISAAKCLLATQVGSSHTAATLPARDDTPRPVGPGDSGHSDVASLVVIAAMALVIVAAYDLVVNL
jgi:hypothetical protein